MTNSIIEFLEALKQKNYAQETIRNYKTALSYFENTEINKASILDFQSHLLSTKPSTRKNYLNKLKVFLKAYYPNLVKFVEIPKQPKEVLKDIPKKSEVETILELPNTATFNGIRDRAILELVYSTGLRRTEIANLLISDIDPQKDIIRVNNGKRGKDRIVPISKRALEWLLRYIHTVRPTLKPVANNVFISTSSMKGFQPHGIAKIISKYSRFSTHKYRHAYATHLMENGIRETTLQRLLGHEKVSTISIYTKITIKELKKSYFKYHKRDSWSRV